jgi:hypothetical protein
VERSRDRHIKSESAIATTTGTKEEEKKLKVLRVVYNLSTALEIVKATTMTFHPIVI